MPRSQPSPAWSRILAATFTASMLAVTAGPAWAADATPPQTAPAATFQVQVIGAVLHPGNVELNDGDRVSLALARAGADTSSNSDLAHICVAHDAKVTTTTVTEIHAKSMECVDLYRALQRGERAADPVLHPGDVIVVMARTKTTQAPAPAREST